MVVPDARTDFGDSQLISNVEFRIVYYFTGTHKKLPLRLAVKIVVRVEQNQRTKLLCHVVVLGSYTWDYHVLDL
jgi:hypothetical protein